ncbi:MAG: polysaccharide deacetylase family protein, partial [Actinomycetes bacterium]
TYAPALAALPGASSTDVVYRGQGRSVLHRTYTNGTWSASTALGGPAVGAPAAAYAGSTLHVVHRGVSNVAYVKARTGGTWDSSWTNLGGTLTSSPAVVGWPDGRVEVFARGAGDDLTTTTFTPGTGWSGWTSLGGDLATAPAAAATGTDELRVCAALASDHIVWCRTRAGGTWYGWTELGGSTYSAPALTVEPGSGRVHVFIRGLSTDVLYVKTYASGTWSSYTRLGDRRLVDGPGAAARASGTVDVIARGRDRALYAKRLRSGAWTSFAQAWTPSAPKPVPTSLRGRNITRVPTTDKVVALTFDGGAGSQGVPAIRATLQRENVPATFFLTGEFIRTYPVRAHQIAVAGFDVADHSNTHPYFTKISDATARTQVQNGRTAIFDTTGVEPKPLFRFPYGAYTGSDITLVNNLGYAPVGWTVDSLGWKGTDGGMSVQKVVDRVLGAAQPGEIVLMHVGAHPKDHTTLDADALPAIIDGLRARGYGFVTLESLMGW